MKEEEKEGGRGKGRGMGEGRFEAIEEEDRNGFWQGIVAREEDEIGSVAKLRESSSDTGYPKRFQNRVGKIGRFSDFACSTAPRDFTWINLSTYHSANSSYRFPLDIVLLRYLSTCSQTVKSLREQTN